ncbi:hypothetical protein GCM10028808_26090 [Spirosoma migulaei]
MKISYNKTAFDRVNGLPNPDRQKISLISEKLLLKENLRMLYEINVKLNEELNEEAFNFNILDRIFNNIFIESDVLDIIESNWKNKSFIYGHYGYTYIKMFLGWYLVSEDPKIKKLNVHNPYEYSIRILERGFSIDQERHPIMYRIGLGDTLSANLQKYAQELPYITSTDDDYLDAIDSYYLQYKTLPPWLGEDNQRGFVK